MGTCGNLFGSDPGALISCAPMSYFSFSDLVSHRILSINAIKGEAEVRLLLDDGRVFTMLHHQDCCESVYLEDICGDLDDLINAQVVDAREETQNDENAGGFGTWTFYILGTTKGTVTLRWYGSSNGYYSESVDFCEAERTSEEKALFQAQFLDDATAVAHAQARTLRL
jgi:hypothetical protein